MTVVRAPPIPQRSGDLWRRTQRLSRPQVPEAAGWHSAPASYHTGPGEGDTGPYRQPDDEDGYDDQYDAGGRFVPGFGDYGDEDGEDDHRGRRGRAPRGPRGPRGPRRRRFRWIAPLVALLVILIPVGIGGSYAYSFYMSKYTRPTTRARAPATWWSRSPPAPRRPAWGQS